VLGEASGDHGPRRGLDGQATTVGALGDAEPLLALPAAPYLATVTVTRTVADNATVAFRGNRYSVPPGLRGVDVRLRHRSGTATVDAVSPAGPGARHAPLGA
jgi:hypothetical protein